MKRLVFSFIGFAAVCLLCLTSCKQNSSVLEELTSDTLCSCPHSFLHFLPYGDFTKAEAQRIVDDMQKNMPILFDELGLQVTILEPTELPTMAYSKQYGRYRADSLLRYENRLKKKDIILMGLTHKDISTTVHGVKDFGIIGYSLCPGQSSVVSTCRIPKCEWAWKTVAHEYLHALGVPHCPNDDPACIMCDAKGKAPKYAQKVGLCHDCAKKAGIPIKNESVKYIK